jgi:hypothetical protein
MKRSLMEGGARLSRCVTDRSVASRCVHLIGLAALVMICLASLPLEAQERPPTAAMLAGNAVKSGAFQIEAPTLENLGFEWFISGDATRPASVTIEYREKGAQRWKKGLPMFRLQGERVDAPSFPGALTYVSPNMFAGSIFDLQPGTEYEARFTLKDPDGVRGDAVKTVTVKTRAEPRPASDGHVFHVYPFDYNGPKQEPSFKGLLQAYYMNSVGGDWINAFPPRVRPGDVILVHAGVYKDDRYRYGHELLSHYTECCNTTYDGTYYLTASGTAERPIVIKAAGDGEVIFDGAGNYNLFNVMAANFNYFEGITFRNTLIAMEAGIKNIAGSVGLTVKHSKFEDVGVGIHTDFAGSGGYYIADNVFIGRHNAASLVGWTPAWKAVPGFAQDSRDLSQYAIKVYGPGHVVAYNRVRNFHDGIDHATYGDPEGYPDAPRNRLPSSVDIYNNDISNVHDNCIEADGAMHNIRVMRNLCANSGEHSYSLQPILGGPAYFIRNILYNSPEAGSIKFSETPAGGVFFHNTWITNFSPGPTNCARPGCGAVGKNIELRNNLFLRQKPDAPVFQMSTTTGYSSSDYNGFFAGGGVEPFEWNSPPFDVKVGEAQPVRRSYADLAQYAAATGQDVHSISIDFDVFHNVPPYDPSASMTVLYDATQMDFRLKPNSNAVDKGTILPNVNDDYEGAAPDLGALEGDRPPPHYGPRD